MTLFIIMGVLSVISFSALVRGMWLRTPKHLRKDMWIL